MHRFLLIFATFVMLSAPSTGDAMSWVVTPDEAAKLVGDATVLDTRSAPKFAWKHVEGAQRVAWDDFTKAGHERGELLGDAAVQEKLQALGVSSEKPVLVVGDPDAWGEDGRIVWMLRTLGHDRAAMVDGGFKALSATDVSTARGLSPTASRGNFVVKRDPRFSASEADVSSALKAGGTLFLDTREAREFKGKTPYGEARGGHLPGAKHLHYKALLGPNGKLLPTEEIKARLGALGIKRESDVIAYCTGGVRSGWMVTVLQSLGYAGAKNYAGSMWEWSAGAPETHPLN